MSRMFSPSISYSNGRLTAPFISTNWVAALIRIVSPASIVKSLDLSPLIRGSYRSKEKIVPLFLINLMSLNEPISNMPRN